MGELDPQEEDDGGMVSLPGRRQAAADLIASYGTHEHSSLYLAALTDPLCWDTLGLSGLSKDQVRAVLAVLWAP